MLESNIDPAEVQYMGIPGDVEPCVLAVDTVVNSENPPRRASIVTWTKDRKDQMCEHLFLFWDWNHIPLTIVHSGFASGYRGGGPHAFSEALCSIFYRGISTNEIVLDESEFNAIENRRLTPTIIERLRAADNTPLEFPWHWIMPRDGERTEGEFWAMRHQPRPNFDFLDDELAAVCRGLFETSPLAAVSEGFKLLEDRLREIVGHQIADDEVLTGVRLLNRALHPDNGVLADKTLPKAEREGVFLMYKGVFQFVRNPLAHKSVVLEDKQTIIEYLYLVDLLLRLLPKSSRITRSGNAS